MNELNIIIGLNESAIGSEIQVDALALPESPNEGGIPDAQISATLPPSDDPRLVTRGESYEN